MGRIHANYDIYVDDALTYNTALISEDQHAHVLKIKTRQGGSYGEVMRLTATGPMMRATSGQGLRWTGDFDGTEVTVTALKVDGGCVPCSKR